jgi:hypothetical protein
MIFRKGSIIGGFRSVLSLHKFCAGQILSGRNYQPNFAAPRTRRGLRGCIFVAAVAVLALVGCNDINPNLGAESSQSSNITFITPAARPAGCPGFMLDVMGIGFTSESVAYWNNSARTTNFESSGELLVTINASDIATQTPVSFFVDTPSGTPGDDFSNFVTFTVASPPTGTCPAAPTFPPTITALNAFDITEGSTLEIAGNYFGGVQNTSTVAFNVAAAAGVPASSTAATVTSWSGTLIEVTVPNIAPVSSVGASVVVTIDGVIATNLTAGANFVNVVPAPSTSSVSSPVLANASHLFSGTPGVRYLAFVSPADPSAATGAGPTGIFLRDTCVGVNTGCLPTSVPVSVGFDGASPNGASRSPAVNANGRFVAFASDANNLVRGDANGATDIFVRDTCIGAQAGCVPSTVRVSTGPDGIESNGASASPSISLDGRFVAFHSVATNLALGGSVDAKQSSDGRFLWDSCFEAPKSCRPSLTRLVTVPPR